MENPSVAFICCVITGFILSVLWFCSVDAFISFLAAERQDYWRQIGSPLGLIGGFKEADKWSQIQTHQHAVGSFWLYFPNELRGDERARRVWSKIRLYHTLWLINFAILITVLYLENSKRNKRKMQKEAVVEQQGVR